MRADQMTICVPPFKVEKINIPERGILMVAPMVRATMRQANPKNQTRRVVKPQPFAANDPAMKGRMFRPGVALFGVLANAAVGDEWACPYGKPGDRLWVRETFFAWGRWETRFSAKKKRDEWHFIDMTIESGNSYLYAADGISDTQAFIKRRGGVAPMYWKRPAIFMPRAASRITLEIVDVRVERLLDISEADALAEGITCENVIVGAANYGGTHHEISEDRYYFDGCHEEGFETGIEAYAALWESINGAGSWDLTPLVWVVGFKRVTP